MDEKAIKGLLIEDDPDDALLFMHHMKANGQPSRFVFERAKTLTEGLAALSKGGIEVVALDVMLPDSRGIETVAKVRSGFPDVPVVVLTGLADEAVGMEALRIGAQDYQIKGGLDGHSLQRAISYAVERHRMLDEIRLAERLKAEIKERESMDKLKDELMSTVSHEMRNPLTVIKVVACGIRDGLLGALNKEQTEMIAMQYRNIQRLEKIVGRILDLSRLESGKAMLAPERVDASALIVDAVQSFALMDKTPEVKIVEEIPEGLPRIYADPDLFAQVLTNLIDNGMRFAHSRISIRAEAVEERPEGEPRGRDGGGVLVMTGRKFVRFSVIDDGNGIPRERIPDLFNKFVQVNRSSKGEGYKGTGLGLAICKEIVERHGGKIWVESAEGIGSAFRFQFPQEPPVPDGPGASPA